MVLKIKMRTYLPLIILAFCITQYTLAQNVGIGTTSPQSKLHVVGDVKITENLKIDTVGSLELGANAMGKEINAGRIGYKLFSDGLDIVGAGKTADSRKITLFAEKGLTTNGKFQFQTNLITSGNSMVLKGPHQNTKIILGSPGISTPFRVTGKTDSVVVNASVVDYTLTSFAFNRAEIYVRKINNPVTLRLRRGFFDNGFLEYEDSDEVVFSDSSGFVSFNFDNVRYIVYHLELDIVSNGPIYVGTSIDTTSNTQLILDGNYLGSYGLTKKLYNDFDSIKGKIGINVDPLYDFHSKGLHKHEGNHDITGNSVLNGSLTLKNGSEGNGKILTSDANGLSTWAIPSSYGISSLSDDNIPRKFGTGLVNSSIRENASTIIMQKPITVEARIKALDINSQILIEESDHSGKQWKIEVNNQNFGFTETGVATPLLIKAGADANSVVMTNDTVQMKKIQVSNDNFIEMGAGVSGKENNAGKIAYQRFSSDALDIVGAGTNSANRKVKLFAEGGTEIQGNLFIKGKNLNTSPTPAHALEIFSGRTAANAFPSGLSNGDIAFNYGDDNGGYKHFIATRHNTTANSDDNSIDFYINNSSTSSGSTSPGTGNNQTFSINANGVQIGTNGTTVAEVIKASVNIDLASLPSGISQEVSFAVPNSISTNATVFVSPTSALMDGISISYARVSVDGTVQIKFINAGNATADQPMTTFNVTIIR
jgi:hypothetical protein